MTEEEHISRIRKARQALNKALDTVARAEHALAGEVRSAYDAGVKTGPISRAAEWSDTYVRSIKQGKVLTPAAAASGATEVGHGNQGP